MNTAYLKHSKLEIFWESFTTIDDMSQNRKFNVRQQLVSRKKATRSPVSEKTFAKMNGKLQNFLLKSF